MIHPKADGVTCAVGDRFFFNHLDSQGLSIDRMQQQEHNQRHEVSVDCCYQQWSTHHHQQLPPVPSPMQQMEGKKHIFCHIFQSKHISSVRRYFYHLSYPYYQSFEICDQKFIIFSKI